MDSGRVLAGRYRLVSPLGSGGMGAVWLAVDDVLGRQVAVKEFAPPPQVTETEADMLRERTLREAQTAARLSHPNVVRIYDVVQDGSRPWIVMELIRARSLRDITQEDGPLDPEHAARVGLQVLAALIAAHELGILHRDVKPSNVLIDDDGRVVLADFGIARADDSPTLTATGMIVGSPSYISPERARGERGGAGADLWSLGATLYAAVEGRPPYDRPGALATLTAVVTEQPDPPRRAGALWPVISGLLRHDEAERLSAAAAAAAAAPAHRAASAAQHRPDDGPGRDPGRGSGRASGPRRGRSASTHRGRSASTHRGRSASTHRGRSAGTHRGRARARRGGRAPARAGRRSTTWASCGPSAGRPGRPGPGPGRLGGHRPGRPGGTGAGGDRLGGPRAGRPSAR